MTHESIVSRTEAIEKNLKRYFTGEPYKQGHTAERFTKNTICVACQYAATKDWTARNREKVNEYNKAYVRSEKYKEMNRKRGLIFYHKNKNEISLELKKKRQDQVAGERLRQHVRKWHKNNPEYVVASQAKRRGRKANANGSFSPDDVKLILKLQRHRCAICREQLGDGYHVDHIIPLAKGGSNDRRNIQVTHPYCNTSKGARDPIEHMQSLGFLL